MANRLYLQTRFEEILGSRNVYFQPPSSISLRYPAIKYSLNDVNLTFANNSAYHIAKSYEVTLIDKNPDSEFVDKILHIPCCRFDRFYVVDNLNHWTFTIHNY